MTELLYKELTGDTLGAYYTAYNGLSRTYPEFICENAMVKLLGKMRVRYRRQPEYQIMYKEWLVGVQRLDILLVDEIVAVECKVVPRLEGIHKAQLFSYMKTVGARVGLLLNFGGSEPEFDRSSSGCTSIQTDRLSASRPSGRWASCRTDCSVPKWPGRCWARRLRCTAR